MVKQILTFARGQDAQRHLIQLRHLLKEMAAMCSQTFPKSIEVRVEAGPDLWPINADATQLQQVLLNLCVNARDAMPEGGKLSLVAANVQVDASSAPFSSGQIQPGPFIHLSVRDTGTGIPEEVRARIFEPFFTTKTPDRGTGLGLSTVQQIVKRHGGFLLVDSALGTGTAFNVYLPADTQSASQPTATDHETLPMGHGELVLVVDDEAAIRNIAAQTLETFGYTVLRAGNGAEALTLCAQHAGELRAMLTDMAMPIMDGSTLIRAAHSILPSLRVALASGMDAGTQTAASSFGAAATLSKPYSAEQLLCVVHRLFDHERGTLIDEAKG